MAEEQPLIIPVRFDFSTADQQFEQREERAKKGLTVPVRTTEGAVPRAGGTPIPSQAAVGAAGAVQADINAAVARGDMSAARHIAAQGAGLGLPVAVPATPPQGGFPVTRIMAGGFGPAGGMMYSSPIGPPTAPGFTPAMSAWQRAKELGKTQVLGMGNYFSLMFGGWEIAQMSQGIRDAQLKASLANTDVERLTVEARGVTQQYGIFGSVLSAGLNLIGDVTPFDSPGKLARTTLLETERRAGLETVRTGQRRRESEAAMRSVLGKSDYLKGMEEARLAQAEKHVEASRRYQELDQQLKEGRAVHAYGLGFLPEVGYELSIKDEGLRAAKAGEMKGALADIRSADATRAATEAELKRQRERSLALSAIETSRLMGHTTTSRAASQADYNAMVAQHAIVEREAIDMFGASSPEVQALRSRNHATTQAERRRIIVERGKDQRELVQIAGQTESSRLALAGSHLAAARAEIDARFGFAGGQFYGIDPSQEGVMRAAREQALQVAGVNEQQRITLVESQHRAAQFAISGQPLLSQFQTIAGQRAAALKGVTDSAEISRIDQASRDAVVGAWVQRTHQIQNIDINQQGRRAQVESLLRRDPISANIAGIVAQARGEEAQLRQSGFFAQADEARRQGYGLLKLEKRQYLEGFEGASVSKDFALGAAMGLFPKSAEDPATVMKNIDDAMRKMQVPGTVAGSDGKGFQDVIKAIEKLPELFKAVIQAN